MRNKNYYINLNDREYLDVLSSLMNKRNKLIQSGKYTDGIDEVIMKIKKANSSSSATSVFLVEHRPFRYLRLNNLSGIDLNTWHSSNYR